MNAPTFAVLATFALAFPALAGCVGAAQASAMEARDPADVAAKKWNPDAALVKVLGLEGSSHWGWMAAAMSGWEGDDGDTRHWDRAKRDGKVGDGKCEVWVYRYLAADRSAAYVVIVDRDGNVLRQGEDETDSDDVPLSDWRVDSDEALEIAKDANAGLRRGVGSEMYGVAIGLQTDEDDGRAKWFVAGGGVDRTGGGGGFVVIDAATGKVLASEGGFASA